MIDLDALKAELEASGLDPSGSWREWLVVGNITVYRRGAVYMSPGDEINQQDFRALAIIARHVAPVVTPEPVTAGERGELIKRAEKIVRCSPCDFPYGPQYIPEAIDAVLTSDVLRSRGITVEGAK